MSVSSEQEALDLDPVPDEPIVHRVATATSDKHQNEFLLYWRRHISVSVPHVKCRDHLGQLPRSVSTCCTYSIVLANERTALGWIRTAQAFAMLGVIIAQVTRLYRSLSPDPVLGFFVVSVPLSSVCHIMALLTTLLGCYRFLHWQAAMARGKAISSGWEITVVSVLSILVSFTRAWRC